MRMHNEKSLDPTGSSQNQKELSTTQEEKLLRSAKELFLNEFPNPDRKGCGDSGTIKALAFGKLSGERAGQWWTHFATCSPCTREFSAFQQQANEFFCAADSGQPVTDNCGFHRIDYSVTLQ